MYQIEVLVGGRWCPIGGKYPTREAAQKKIEQYLEAAASQRMPGYRIVRA